MNIPADITVDITADFATRLAETTTILKQVADDFQPAVFASSFAAEDMVLTDLIVKNQLNISIFSIDTGRLPEQTLATLEKIKTTYQYPVSIFYPDAAEVNNYISQHGVDGFYNSVESRKACCHARKVEPLQRALAGSQAWITGQRRDQSTTRSNLNVREQDVTHHMAKFNPLADWSLDDVWYYIREHNVPYNTLHDAGYPSIGCAPCTRAVQPGEDIRAGRWWWESPEHKECGLHRMDGRQIGNNPKEQRK